MTLPSFSSEGFPFSDHHVETLMRSLVKPFRRSVEISQTYRVPPLVKVAIRDCVARVLWGVRGRFYSVT